MKQVEFGNKKMMTVVTVTKDFELGFDDRVVYSSLVFLARYNTVAREGQVAAYLDPSIRVPSAVSRLIHAGLVERREDGIRAVEPQGARVRWFAWQTARKPWHQSFRFVMAVFPSPESPLSFRELFLYSTLCSISDDDGLAANTSRNGLVALTRISKPTVLEGLDHLVECGLIDLDEGERLHVMVHPMTACHAGWLVNKVATGGENVEEIRRRLLEKRAARMGIEAARSDGLDVAPPPHSATMNLEINADTTVVPENEMGVTNDPAFDRDRETGVDPPGMVDPGRAVLESALDARYTGRDQLDGANRAFVVEGKGGHCAPSPGEYLALIERHASKRDFLAAVSKHMERRREAILR